VVRFGVLERAVGHLDEIAAEFDPRLPTHAEASANGA